MSYYVMKFRRVSQSTNFFRGNLYSRMSQKDFFRGYLILRIAGPFAKFANIFRREDFWH